MNFFNFLKRKKKKPLYKRFLDELSELSHNEFLSFYDSLYDLYIWKRRAASGECTLALMDKINKEHPKVSNVKTTGYDELLDNVELDDDKLQEYVWRYCNAEEEMDNLNKKIIEHQISKNGEILD